MCTQYPRSQFLENGVLFNSPRRYLDFLIEDDPRGAAAFTPDMWTAENFDDLFGLLARRAISEARRLARVEARSRRNIILNVDSYKISMPLQYPAGTRRVWSYIEARGGLYDESVFFGTQMFVDEYLTVRVTADMVDEAAAIYKEHGEPFYKQGWDYIVEKLGGRLPVEVRAVPEGTRLPVKNALVSIVNTDDKCWWLTTHIETALLRAIWYPTTVATKSYAAKKVIKKWLALTSDNGEALLPSRLHDFGARGSTSAESAEIAGLAHLVNFVGTDTVGALAAARRYYDCPMAGFSIPAAEHSTITAWGRDGEVDAYRNMLRRFANPGSIVAVVSDSYDLWNAIEKIWGTELYDHVVRSGATVVVRPDSGDVLTVPVQAISRLAEKFGTTTNSKGYRVLNHVRVLQGDGIRDEKVIDQILSNLEAAGFAADNIAFGMGGGLHQLVSRDDMKWAMKASAIFIGEGDRGEWREVYKDPITDPGKVSKRGRLATIHDNGWSTVPLDGNKWQDQMGLVFRNGDAEGRTTFQEVRARAA